VTGLREVDPNSFAKPAPEIPWIIKGLVAQGALTLMAGVGGLGKSSLALALAAACVQGQTAYAGFEIRKSLRMMYVDAENGFEEMHRRAHYFRCYSGFYEFDGNLEEHLPSLAHHAGNGEDPAFIILDSFRALYPGVEEDNSKSVLPALQALQRIARYSKCGILVLHHTTKGGGVFRGSGEFQNRPEITVTMKRDRDGVGRYLDWEKCRLGIEPNRHGLIITGQNGGMSWEYRHPQQQSNSNFEVF
jgi:RecA-family ATPase